MKNIKKLLFALVMVMAFTVVSPSVFTGQTITVQAAVKISKKSTTLIKGQTTTLKISGTKKKAKWSSDKKSVATVNSKGKVTAKKTGTAKITAKIGSKKYTCTVKVQTPKLSKTKVSVNAGDTYTLKLSGTDQKVTWKSSKTSVATVNSKGVITAKKAGTAKITATVLKKKYTCTVTVKKKANSNVTVEKFDAEKAKKNISVEYHDTGHGVVAILKNNNKYSVAIEAKMVYFKNGKMLDVDSTSANGFESGRKIFLSFYAPHNLTGDYVEYDDYKLSFQLFEETGMIKPDASKIKVSSNVGSDGIVASVTNFSNVKLDYICVVAVYYDKNGNIIDTENAYAGCYNPNTTDYISFGFDFEDGEPVIPYKYELYVNFAYKYVY